ncbi:MAG: sensor domain-containing diguanylate cyclase [Campylobacterota bacterium]|nr:sensor domain-containing diguanylate cyclase [Campylobacterota bacterium]
MDNYNVLMDYVKHIEEAFIISKTDKKGIITYANDLFCEISKYSREELIGKPHNIVRHPDVSPKVFELLWNTIEDKKIFKGVLKNRNKNGETYITEIKVFPIVVDDEIIEYISVRTDITTYAKEKEDDISLAKQNFKNERTRFKELSNIAYTDALTKVFNRLKFDELAEVEILSAEKFELPLTIALIDIDHFKKFNDNYGHLIGDEVLIMMAQNVNDSLRNTDIFARWGGEEFVILFKSTELESARIVSEKLREGISNLEHKIAGNITASFGLTQYKKDDSLESILKRCDEALYEAKANGRNRVEVRK